MTRHTSAPWYFDGPADNIIVWSGPNHRVCFMTSDGNAKADARLISAAPQLLEVVQLMQGANWKLDDEVGMEIRRRALVAVQKATDPIARDPAPQEHVLPGDAMLNIARLAGEHGIRYPTNAAMQTFLGRILSDFQNEEISRLESLHRSEIADMAERFRSVNVSEAVKQLADILPAAPAEHVVAGDSLPKGHEIIEQADMTDGRVSQTVRTASGEEYERVVHADEAYGTDE